MRRRLALLTLAPLLAACWGVPYVAMETSTNDPRTLTQSLLYHGTPDGMALELRGEVPLLDAEAVAASFSRLNRGQEVQFTLTDPSQPQPDWRVVVQVDQGYTDFGHKPCSDAPIPDEDATDGRVALHAAYCFRDKVESSAVGVWPEEGGTEEQMHRLLSDLIRSVFPNPHRNRRGDCPPTLPNCTD